MERKIIAAYDQQGVYVYQAFSPEIVEEALRLKTFGKRFHLDRLTWIKPSFGWMLYRSHYATKAGQERIVKIKVSHAGFLQILENAIPTIFDRQIFTSGRQWREQLKRSDVRYQWDPDRDKDLQKLSRKALQIGLEGDMVKKYIKNWIISIEDVTPLARQFSQGQGKWPEEREYSVDEKIQRVLGMDG